MMRKLAILAGMLLLGFCAGGIVSRYSFEWAVYGMGHSFHVCNVVGQAMLLLCPASAFAVLVLSSMHLNDFLVSDDEGIATAHRLGENMGHLLLCLRQD